MGKCWSWNSRRDFCEPEELLPDATLTCGVSTRLGGFKHKRGAEGCTVTECATTSRDKRREGKAST